MELVWGTPFVVVVVYKRSEFNPWPGHSVGGGVVSSKYVIRVGHSLLITAIQAIIIILI